MKKLIIATCTFSFIACLLTSCGIDLSHKHYLNDYGFCVGCQKDQAVWLESNENGEYVYERLEVKSTYNYTFFKFVANEEKGIEIFAKPENCEVQEMQLLSDEAMYITSVYENESLVYDYPLTVGITYYVRVKLTDVGYISLNVHHLN